MTTPQPEPSLAGRTLSHYRVISLLGAGGMGAVYLTEDTRLNRTVALKTLRPDLSVDAERMQRFIREAKAASALNHPNVATIYDVGEADGIRFIAMEYVEGTTLAERIGGRPLDASKIIDIGIQIGAALEAAHAKGITHRDIKPGNVMLSPDGRVKVLDFGLAKTDSALASTLPTIMDTATGQVVGSIPYMSPEQVLGQDLDHRSDLFSLGITLYEMCTGRIPFPGATSGQTMDRILHQEPDSVTRLNARAPVELERIVRKCLEKDRERRYSSAHDLVVDFKNLQRDSADRFETPRKPQTITSRKWVLAVVAIVVLIAGIAISQLFSTGPDAAIDSIVVLPLVNDTGNPDAEALSEGISESLINSLTSVPSLVVTSRTTAFRYKGSSKTGVEIARELGMRAVITGRLAQRGDNLNIQVELTDDTGDQLWGDSYASKMANILTIQEDIVARIFEELQIELSPQQQQRLTKRYTDNVNAYTHYVQGRHQALTSTREGFEKSLDHFRRALELDDRYALAYAGLSEAYLAGADLYLPALEAGPKAKDAAIKALGLDSNLSEAHCALGYVSAIYDWDWATSDKAFSQARAIDPNSPCVLDWYPGVLALRGRFVDAIAEARRALQLDPNSAVRHNNLGVVLYLAGSHVEAEPALRRALELDSKFFFPIMSLGLNYEQMGLFEKAVAEYRKLPSDFRDHEAFVARGLALTGRREDARKILRRLEEANPRIAATWGLAMVYDGLGDRDQALAWLQKARDEHFVGITSLNVDPAFKNLRADRRFRDLIVSIGLQP